MIICWLTWSYVASAVTSSLVPHRRSPVAAASRRARAWGRGFLLPTAPGLGYIQVSSPVAPRAKLLVKSLGVRRQHGQLTGTHFHHASRAAAAARPLIAEEQYVTAVAAIRAGNVARNRRWDFVVLMTF
jgi:hypothetical protein